MFSGSLKLPILQKNSVRLRHPLFTLFWYDCTVKNIERANIRFKVANTLRLVNENLSSE